MTTDRPSQRPPKATQFKPGQSGNPAGRPRGSKNLQTTIQQELGKMVSVKENGRTRRVSKLDLVVQRIVHDSIKGQPKAIDLLMRILAHSPGAEPLGRGERARS